MRADWRAWTDPPLVTGGSVISVPPWLSEVALKFDTV
jgi:hypothetical protein